MAISLSQQTGAIQTLTSFTFSAGTRSNNINFDEFGEFEEIMIVAPASVTGTITVEINRDPTADETNDAQWATFQSPSGTDVSIAADKAIQIHRPAAYALRLSSTLSTSDVFTVFGVRSRVAGV